MFIRHCKLTIFHIKRISFVFILQVNVGIYSLLEQLTSEKNLRHYFLLVSINITYLRS